MLKQSASYWLHVISKCQFWGSLLQHLTRLNFAPLLSTMHALLYNCAHPLFLCCNLWTKTPLIVFVFTWAGCIFIFCIRLCRHHSLHFLRIAGVDQGRGTLTAAKNISRLTMWEVVLFLTVSSKSGPFSLDSAVHRIVAHVKRWMCFSFACSYLTSPHFSDINDEPLVPSDTRIFYVQVGGNTPFFRCFVLIFPP